jgi:hypothetical protein
MPRRSAKPLRVLAALLACALVAALAAPAWCLRSDETTVDMPNVKGKQIGRAHV